MLWVLGILFLLFILYKFSLYTQIYDFVLQLLLLALIGLILFLSIRLGVLWLGIIVSLLLVILTYIDEIPGKLQNIARPYVPFTYCNNAMSLEEAENLLEIKRNEALELIKQAYQQQKAQGKNKKQLKKAYETLVNYQETIQK